MARLARVVAPGYPHHVTQRGNRRQQTFFGEDDYREYLSLLVEWCRRHGVRILAGDKGVRSRFLGSRAGASSWAWLFSAGHGAQVAPLSDANRPVMVLDDFNGRAAILGAGIVWGGKLPEMKAVPFRGDGAKMKVLVMGNQFQEKDSFLNASPHAKVAFLNNRAAIGPDGTVPMPDEGKADPAFLREMLKTTRTVHPEPLTPLGAGVTDVRLFRVTTTGVRIKAE